MFFSSMIKPQYFKSPISVCRLALIQERCMSQEMETKYNEVEKEKILEVMNGNNPEDLSMYEITKTRLKKFNEWKANNGQVKTLSDIELIDGFNDKTAKKLFDSILEGPQKKLKGALRIKGQFLHPNLSESVRQSCKSVLAVHIAVNSVCWAHIDRTNYKLTEWRYHSINYPDGKKFQITDILNIAWQITNQLPHADVYVMKAEATTLRAAGSDPNNPKVIAVNLQKAQMVAMIVALINARSNRFSSTSKSEREEEEDFSQKVYFMRPTLPYRLYGTLVGNEKVSTEAAVGMLLQNVTAKCMKNTHAYVPENLQNMFKSNRDLQKDMLGHCLLLALTFMDVCIYKNQESINKLAKRED